MGRTTDNSECKGAAGLFEGLKFREASSDVDGSEESCVVEVVPREAQFIRNACSLLSPL